METHKNHEENMYEPSFFTSKKGLRAIIISSLILFFGSLFQLAVVLLSGSISLLSDTIHNFGDAVTALPMTIAFLVGRKKPTSRFTYGYGKVEDLAGVSILFFMLASAFYAAYVSIESFFHPHTVTHLWVVASASIVGFLINEGAAIFRIKVGKEIHSEALVTDGKHARMDGFTSLAVLIGSLGVSLGFPIVDPIVGFIISIIILHTVWESGKVVFTRLLDGVDPAIVEEVKDVIRKVSEVKGITETRVRWLGHKLHAEVNIAIDPKLSVEEGHNIAQKVHRELGKHLPHLSHIIIHIDPLHSSGEKHHHHHQ